MCGRYQFTAEESRDIQEIIREIERSIGGPVRTGEIYPTNEVPILVELEGKTAPVLCGWGFPGFKGKQTVINARSETAGEKPMFRGSLAARRCVIPTTGFFEWDREKNKHLFNLPMQPELYMAGLWNEFAGERRFVILTTAANPSVAPIHHRMPVVLTKDAINPWVENHEQAHNIIKSTPPELIQRVV